MMAACFDNLSHWLQPSSKAKIVGGLKQHTMPDRCNIPEDLQSMPRSTGTFVLVELRRINHTIKTKLWICDLYLMLI